MNMYVKYLYIENGKVYKLDGNELGDYNKETLSDILDKGTSQIYNYKNENGTYYLSYIRGQN